MGKYNKEFIIPYYDCDGFGYIRPVALVEYLVEASSLQSDQLGLGFKELMERSYGWILSKWKVKIYAYPRALDKIRVETWTSGANKFYVYREFNVYDKEDNLLIKASTLWILMDTKRKRPIRIPDDLYDNYNPIMIRNFSEFLKFNKDFQSHRSMDFRVRKTDIDYNKHVNNAKYLNWFLEPIPLEVDEKYYLSEIDIYYKKEIQYNHIIESKISKQREVEDSIEFFHEIYNKDTATLITQARTVWKEKV